MPEPLVSEETLAAALKAADGEQFLDRLFGQGTSARDLARHTGNTFLAVFVQVQDEQPGRNPAHTLTEVFLSAFVAGFAMGENAAAGD